MSMRETVYIGPYLEVSNLSGHALLWKHENVLCDGRGEARVDGEPYYLVPNCDIGANRQMRFGRGEDTPVVELDASDRHEAASHDEIADFWLKVEHAVHEMESAGASVNAKWGVVCGVF